MKVLVLGGSPKGDVSVTMQYVEYLRIARPDIDVEIHCVARDVRKLERDRARWAEVITGMHSADLVLWAFPLYILLVCAQMKRFVELLFEREGAGAFQGVHTATLSTSLKFFDNTAHEYVRAVAEDLGMRFVSAWSAQMSDLQRKEEQEKLLNWYSMLEDAVAEDYAEPRRYAPLPDEAKSPGAGPSLAEQIGDLPAQRPRPVASGSGRAGNVSRRTVILTDCAPDDVVLQHMTERMRMRFAESGSEGSVTVHHLSEAGMRGGCMGCMKCGYNYECSYTGKDGYIDFYNDVVLSADTIVLAGRARDRYLSSVWKQFFDRSFFNTHTPVLIGKQIGCVIAGPLSRLDTLREILRGWMELHRAHSVGFVSDEFGTLTELDQAVDNLAIKLDRNADLGVVVPQTFLGVGGMKIFRDDIWGGLRMIFGADHRAYRRMRIYDFPQRRPLARALASVVSVLLRIPALRKAFYTRLPKVMPLQFTGALAQARARGATVQPRVDESQPDRREQAGYLSRAAAIGKTTANSPVTEGASR